MRSDWPFDQAKNVVAITTRQILEENYPILQVIHYADDHAWAFTCGTTNQDEDGRIIGMGNIVDKDPTLKEIADLPPGWIAQREAVGDLWTKFQSQDI